MSLRISIKSSNLESFRPVVKDYNKTEVVIGRHSSNDFVLDQEGVSERHLRIRTTGSDSDGSKRIFVTDLGSASGVLVGDSKIKAYKEVEISAEDEVKIGEFTLCPSLYRSSSQDSSKFFAKSKKKTGFFKQAPKAKEKEPIKVIKVAEDKGKVKGSGLIKKVANGLDVSIAENTSSKLSLANVFKSAGSSTTGTSSPEQTEPVTSQKSQSIKLVDSPEPKAEKAKPLEVSKTFVEKSQPVVSSLSSTKSGESLHRIGTSDILDFDFEAKALVALKGQIVHRGSPLEGVTVDAGIHGKAVTGENGSFNLGDFPEATPFKISVSKNGYNFACQNPEGELNPSNKIEFVATKLLNVSGRVSHKGQGISGVEIDCGRFGKVVTDDSGRYTIRDIPEETEINLEAKKDGFQFSRVVCAR